MVRSRRLPADGEASGVGRGVLSDVSNELAAAAPLQRQGIKGPPPLPQVPVGV